MQPSLKQLKVFCAVVEQEGFRSTGEILHTSQPGLSRAVKNLEDILGVELLSRTTRSVKPTEAGEEFYHRAKKILSDVDEALRITRDVASGFRGNLRISYIDFALIGELPGILGRFRALRPRVQIATRFIPTREQVALLINGETDVGFVFGQPEIAGFECRPITREGLVALLPQDHVLASQHSVRLSELRGEPFVVGDARWEAVNTAIYTLCLREGFSPVASQIAYTRDEFIGFVLAGNGVALYPACINNTPRPGLACVPVSDVPPTFTTSALWRTSNASTLLSAFLEQLPYLPPAT